MPKSNLRMPAVAGKFYPQEAQELRKQVASFIEEEKDKSNALACILPHAGYMYSGAVAGKTLSCINLKEKIILIGPNHTGYGLPFSIMTGGSWKTPLGQVKIDATLAGHLLEQSAYLKEDEQAHLYEHSLEVELPFLQYLKKDFEFVPIIISSDQLSSLKGLGKEIAGLINRNNLKSSTLLIASSDMTHYESQQEAERKDNEAIEAILELDEDKLMKRITGLNISMCGYAPVITVISAAKALGAKKARLIKYQTSGEVTGDTESVVGYAGVIIE